MIRWRFSLSVISKCQTQYTKRCTYIENRDKRREHNHNLQESKMYRIDEYLFVFVCQFRHPLAPLVFGLHFDFPFSIHRTKHCMSVSLRFAFRPSPFTKNVILWKSAKGFQWDHRRSHINIIVSKGDESISKIFCNFLCLMFCFCLPNVAFRINTCISLNVVCNTYVTRSVLVLYIYVCIRMDYYEIMVFPCGALGTFFWELLNIWWIAPAQKYEFQITVRFKVMMKLLNAEPGFHFDLFAKTCGKLLMRVNAWKCLVFVSAIHTNFIKLNNIFCIKRLPSY